MDQTHREGRRAAQWGNGDTTGLNAGRGINEDDQIDHGEVLSQFRCELKANHDVGAVDGCLVPKCLGHSLAYRIIATQRIAIADDE